MNDALMAAQVRLAARRLELGLPAKSGPEKLRRLRVVGDVAEIVAKARTKTDRDCHTEGCDGVRDELYSSFCPVCRARREREEREREARVRAARERAIRENTAPVLERCGFFRRHAVARLEDSTAHGVGLRSWCASPTEGLLFAGPTGTGKTWLAAAVARELVCAGKSVIATMAGDLFRRIWATYRDGAQECEQGVIAELRGIDVLVIDDLGFEGRASPAVISALHGILSARNDSFRPTIVTTNLTVKEIEAHYGPSIASRIRSWRRYVVAGEDLRYDA